MLDFWRTRALGLARLVLVGSAVLSLSAALAPADDLLSCLPSEPAVPLPGSLVICGGGKLPEPVMNRFVELAGGSEARIVVIPTASSLADTPEELETKIAFWRQVKVAALNVLHTRSREEADNP